MKSFNPIREDMFTYIYSYIDASLLKSDLTVTEDFGWGPEPAHNDNLPGK